MSSRFSFRNHVCDIDNSFTFNSPHSNTPTHHSQTPQSKHTTPTSVSPQTATNNSITSTSYKPPSHLKIRLPEPNPSKSTNNNTNTQQHQQQQQPNQAAKVKVNTNEKLVAQQFTFLTVPSDSENHSSSPLLSEPSPNPASPLALNTNDTKSTPSLFINNSSDPQIQESQHFDLNLEEEEEEEDIYSLSINTTYQTQNTFSAYSYNSTYSTYPANHSPASITSTTENLTPLYTGILEAQTSLLPDLSLAPLDLVASPTPNLGDPQCHKLEIVDETPTHCNRNKRNSKNKPNLQQQPQQQTEEGLHLSLPLPPDLLSNSDHFKYLSEANKNYHPSSDSDYEFEKDINSKQTSFIYLTDLELEHKLITMGSCCSDAQKQDNKIHPAHSSSLENNANANIVDNNDDVKHRAIRVMSNEVEEDNTFKQTKTAKDDIESNNNYKNMDNKDGDHDTKKKKGGGLQIEITSADHDNVTGDSYKPSFADKYFRSKEKVKRNREKKKLKQQKNGKKSTSPKHAGNNNNIITNDAHKNGSVNHSAEDDYLPPIPTPYDSPQLSNHSMNNSNTNNKKLSLLNANNEATHTDITQTFADEQEDVVSPMQPHLNKIHSLTNAKRASTSALSSPIHSVRLSITPNGHLVPIAIVDHSDDEDPDRSISTTDSNQEKEHTKYSEINTPVDFLKKHQTITKFVSPQHSQTSDKNVLSRRKRRHGVSERHTLTFSKPPIPVHELPQSPKFAEISLDVMKPIEFLQEKLRGNLLFSGVDPEFADKMVNKVVDLMRAADFEPDEILMHQGAEGDAFYAVENGSFDILVQNINGDEKTVAVAKRGDCVGEYALLYNQPRTATLKATEKSRVWGITAQQFANMRQEIMDWNVERFERRQEFIHSIPLFQKLEQHELLNMTHACHAEIYDINDYIIAPGKEAKKNTNVYIIMEGTVIVSYAHMDENEMSSPIQRVTTDQTDDGLVTINEYNNDNKTNHNQQNESHHHIRVSTDHLAMDLNLNLNLNNINSQTSDLKSVNSSGDPPTSNTTKYTHTYNNTHSHTYKESKDSIVNLGKQLFAHPENNQSDRPNLSDPPILEDMDSSNTQNGFDSPGPGIGLSLNPKSRDSETVDTNNNRQSNKRFNLPLSLSAVNSVNSVQSVHLLSNPGHPQHALIDMNLCRGDKELGPSDYFARNLFVNQYDDEEEEEIVCARAHTRCKVLKIRRDDFVLIMASQQSGHLLFNDNGVVGDGELEHKHTWNHHIRDISLSDLEEKDVLGIGSFGKVTLVEHKKNGQTYALKAVSKYRVVKTGQEEHIINEKRVLTMLDSPFCVKLFATFKTETCIYFLTEVVLGGELFTVLRYNEKFDKNATRFYAGCVILALEHLHSKDIIYRDLKPENLLLNDRGYLQLTDFGFAKKRNTTCTLCGTPQYLAPEVIHNWVQSFATDWWALGVLLYEMVVGHPPFEDDENIKMYEKILVHEPAFPDDINAKLRHLIQKLLEKNAYQRLGSGAGGARQVKQHPFFKNKLNWNDLYEQKLEPPYKPNIDSHFDTSNFDHFSDYEESSDEEDLGDVDFNSNHFSWVEQF